MFPDAHVYFCVGRESENDLKEQGPRALWDNLDDIILLVTELQEVNHIDIITGLRNVCILYPSHAFVVTAFRLYMIVVVILE